MIDRAPRLDCAPLAPTVSASLSDADLRRIEPVQRALLRPLDHDGVEAWRRSVNRALLTAFDSDAAMFQLEVEGAPIQFSDEFEDSAMARYVDELMPSLARERRLYQRIQELGAGNRSILWGADLKWLYQSDYFNELVMDMRAFDPLWAAAPTGANTYPAVIHTYHDRRSSDLFFDAADVSLMRLVQPALEAGARTALRVADSRRSVSAMLENSGEGAAVYDLRGRLLHRNAAMTGRAAAHAVEKKLVEVGADMARGFRSDALQQRLRPENATRIVAARGRRYQLSAVRLGEGMFTFQPAVLVTVTTGEAPLPDLITLRERFGLTRRQAEVARLLARRKTNPEIAEALIISPHTVRSHTEAVMLKLGINDRREVGRVLRQDVAGTPDAPSPATSRA